MPRISIDDIKQTKLSDELIQRVTGGYDTQFRGGVFVAVGDTSAQTIGHDRWVVVESVSLPIKR